MARGDLPEALIEAGKVLLGATDSLAMQAQGAMWIYDHTLEDWRFYLVTSLVDNLGRRKVYRMLLDVFERVDLPASMTIEDVHLGSPSEPFFQFLNCLVNDDGNSIARFHDCTFDGVVFDGVIYRSERNTPSSQEAHRIEKRFSRRVKDLVASGR